MAKEYKKLYKYTYNYSRILCEELEIKEEKEGRYWIRKGRFLGNTKAIKISDIGKLEARIGLNYKHIQYVVEERNDDEFRKLLVKELEKYRVNTINQVNKQVEEDKKTIAKDVRFEVVSVKPPKKKIVVVDGIGGVERYEIGENENIQEAINERHIDYDDIKIDNKDGYYNSNVNIIKEDKEPLL